MNPSDPIDVLNRLLQIVYRSLPVYLQGTRPWVKQGDEKALEQLAQIAADHRYYAQRIADAVQQAGACFDPGQFPVGFTGLHDVSVDFLVKRVTELQKRDLHCIEQCAASLAGSPRLRALAEEVLGNARGHLEMLQEVMMNAK